MPSLTVLTYNIHHGVGIDGVLDLDRVAAVIESAQADLIGLQEVDRGYGERSDFLDELDLLAKRLGMHAAFGGTLPADDLPAEDLPAENLPAEVQPADELPATGRASVRLGYGNAALTPHPLRSVRNRSLPHRPGDGNEPRRLLDALVDTPLGEVRFAVTHLQYGDSTLRRAQVVQVRRLLAAGHDSAATTAAGVPRVLVGDFNDTPDSPDLAGFWVDYVDAWTQAGAGDGLTIEAGSPSQRIDYVLHDTTTSAVSARVLDTPASDHLPVCVVLARREQPRTEHPRTEHPRTEHPRTGRSSWTERRSS